MWILDDGWMNDGDRWMDGWRNRQTDRQIREGEMIIDERKAEGEREGRTNLTPNL